MQQILVVDDSGTVRQHARLALEAAGFEVVEACDGMDGLAKLAQYPNVRAVLLDVNMPRMSGLEMLEAMQRDGFAQPALILTTEVEATLVNRAKRAGAKGWLVKPVKPELLAASFRKILGK